MIKKTTLFGLLIVSSSICQASIPNIIGTWSGKETFTKVNCTNQANNGNFADPLTYIINQQNGASFSGTNGNGQDTVSGTIDAMGNVSGTYSFANGQKGTFSGTISGNNWNTSSTVTTPGIDGCSGSGTQSLTRTSGGATSAQVQQSRQIVRTTNTLISQHLASEVSKAFSFMPDFKTDNKLGASADSKNDYQPDAFWGTVSLSEISEDGKPVQFNTNIYQFVGGIDKRIGDFFVGTALTYAYSETKQTGANSNSQVFGVTPYGAWSITDYLFVSGLAGYNYTAIREEATGTDTDVHDYILEGNVNLHKILWDAVILKFRLGSRYHHTEVSSVSATQDGSSDELMWLGDLELGYRFRNGLISHIGTYYEYFDREASVQQATPIHDGILYLRGGMDYPIRENLSLSAKVQADMNDEDTDTITGSVSIRLEI
jgi:hypothetical protein